MSGHLLGGLVLGVLAVVVGIGWIFGALRRRSDRAETAPTYAATGGVVLRASDNGMTLGIENIRPECEC